MNYLEVFSPDYSIARERFRLATSNLDYHHQAYSIDRLSPTGEDLTIDVAIADSANPQRTVIISSGLHGVEGFLGSAIQLALLSQRNLLSSLSSDTRVVFIHALNPYGFAWRRRWNEDNVDLNRNFLLSDELFSGSPKDYPQFDAFLNPTSPPSRFEPYILQAFWLIAKYGMTSLKNTLPVGQYDFPKGLFFGGHAPSKTQGILAENLPEWVGNTSEVLHIDLHSGLGRSGTYKLLLDASTSEETCLQLSQIFGSETLELPKSDGVSYEIRGGLKTWCQELLPDCHYNILTAEFGTYSSVQVLQALRAENRAYWWGTSEQSYEWTKRQLVEMFAPKSSQWRESCIVQGLDICKKALTFS